MVQFPFVCDTFLDLATKYLSSQYLGNYLAGHAKKTLRVPKAPVKPDLYQVFIKLPIELKLAVRQLLEALGYSLLTLVLFRSLNIVTRLIFITFLKHPNLIGP